ncbi:unnamed protein product [Phytomonas sp. EM1]|nr:unnamed protein product [Phytomonas sp. EM1]|eukprot:CCW61918.1 unnamed protein product [Phytomonas sp. isolate EM1]
MHSDKEFSLVGLLVESGEPKNFESLKIVHNTSARKHDDDVGEDEERLVVMISNDVFVENVPVKTVIKRLSTPERIRRLTDKLSAEVHELMERHDVRKNRQRTMNFTKSSALAKSRQPSCARPTNPPMKAASKTSKNNSGNGVLPDIYTYFKNSRSRHLMKARQNKVVFPLTGKSDGCSSKGLDGFSMRFNVDTVNCSKNTPN